MQSLCALKRIRLQLIGCEIHTEALDWPFMPIVMGEIVVGKEK